MPDAATIRSDGYIEIVSCEFRSIHDEGSDGDPDLIPIWNALQICDEHLHYDQDALRLISEACEATWRIKTRLYESAR